MGLAITTCVTGSSRAQPHCSQRVALLSKSADAKITHVYETANAVRSARFITALKDFMQSAVRVVTSAPCAAP